MLLKIAKGICKAFQMIHSRFDGKEGILLLVKTIDRPLVPPVVRNTYWKKAKLAQFNLAKTNTHLKPDFFFSWGEGSFYGRFRPFLICTTDGIDELNRGYSKLSCHSTLQTSWAHLQVVKTKNLKKVDLQLPNPASPQPKQWKADSYDPGFVPLAPRHMALTEHPSSPAVLPLYSWESSKTTITNILPMSWQEVQKAFNRHLL